MPKKGGKKGGKKGKKGPTDWGEMPREKWVEVEVRNGAWTSMRFIERLSTTTKIVRALNLIVGAGDFSFYHPSCPLSSLAIPS